MTPRHPFNKERILDYVLKNGGTLVSEHAEFIGSHRAYLVQCKAGHKFHLRSGQVNRNSWCGKCWRLNYRRLHISKSYASMKDELKGDLFTSKNVFLAVHFAPRVLDYRLLYEKYAKTLKLQFSWSRQIVSLRRLYERMYEKQVFSKPRVVLALVLFLYSDVGLNKICQFLKLAVEVSIRQLYRRLELSTKSLIEFREEFLEHKDLELCADTR